jgi:hypothetical protein
MNELLWIHIGLCINIVVAGFIGIALYFNIAYSQLSSLDVYGPDTGSRRILICMYLTITLLSFYALVVVDSFQEKLRIISVLFPFQIIYKLMSLFVVNNVKNPVPWFNLVIAIYHSFVLYQNK